MKISNKFYGLKQSNYSFFKFLTFNNSSTVFMLSWGFSHKYNFHRIGQLTKIIRAQYDYLVVTLWTYNIQNTFTVSNFAIIAIYYLSNNKLNQNFILTEKIKLVSQNYITLINPDTWNLFGRMVFILFIFYLFEIVIFYKTPRPTIALSDR